MKSSPDQARGMVHMGYSRTEESTQFTLTFPHRPPPHFPGAAGAKSLVQMRRLRLMSQPCLFANIHTNRCLFKKGSVFMLQ